MAYDGLVNGETGAVLGGGLTYGGTSQGAVNAGTYGIDPSGLTSENYAIRFASGALTITGSPSNESVDASKTSTQNGINGSQESQGSAGGPHNPSMGPGTGSGNVTPGSTLTPPAITGALLTTATFTTPVEISTTGQTTTLTVGDGTASGPLNEVGSLPVFTSIGGSVPALQGTFLVRESGNALSLTPTTPSGQPEASPLTLESVSGQSAPFTLTLTNGMSLQLTATVTATGVLVVTAPDKAGSVGCATGDPHGGPGGASGPQHRTEQPRFGTVREAVSFAKNVNQVLRNVRLCGDEGPFGAPQ